MEKDKILHFTCCLLITIIMSLITNIPIGFVTAVIIGLGKELIDKLDYGLFDIKDLIADILGASLGTVIMLLL